MTPYERSKAFSNTNDIRTRLVEIVPSDDVVVACGSYARREASESSDIDFFIIANQPNRSMGEASGTAKLPWADRVQDAIREIVPVDPAEGGAFAKVEYADEMLRNIGGDQDTNPKITRRMLFLLEGEWLFNEAGFRKARRDMLERYTRSSITDHQLALFLLNDVIRYYRTVAVDYEFKTEEGETPKPWGIRNIKLIFARKLLYTSGLFSVAMTADRAWEQKIGVLERLFDLPVIDRMEDICGKTKVEKVLVGYNHFLSMLEDGAVREYLKKMKKEDRNETQYRELKNEGHHFTRELLILFENAFDMTHPIRRAVIF